MSFFVITPDVRLVSNDNRPHTGKIEVFFNNEWGQICFQENVTTSLSVICAQLGYGSVGALSFRANISVNSRIWLSDAINCTGNESTIFDCLASAEIDNVGKIFRGICSDGAAGVVCPMRELCITKHSYIFSIFYVSCSYTGIDVRT